MLTTGVRAPGRPRYGATLAALLLIALPVLAGAPRTPDERIDRPTAGAGNNNLVVGPSIDMPNARAYSAYITRRYFTGHDVFFNVSVNQGGTWREGDQRLNTIWSPGSSDGDMKTVLVRAPGDNYVHVLMVSRISVKAETYVASSSDAGQTWGTPYNVTAFPNDDLSYGHRLLASVGGKVHAIWYDESDGLGGSVGLYSVFMRTSTNGGTTWGSKLRVNVPDASGSSLERASEPAACADGQHRFYAVFKDKRATTFSTASIPGRIEVRTSLNDAASFGAEVKLDKLDPTNATESQTPAVACWGDTVKGTAAVVWADKRSGDWDIYFSITRDGGATWPNETRVDGGSPAATNATNPKVAIVGDAQRIYVAWEDDRAGAGAKDIYFTHSENAGASWAAAQRLNTNTNAGILAVESWDLAVSGSDVWLVWADNRDAASGVTARDIFMSESHDGGVSFTQPPPVRLDSGAPAGSADSVAVKAVAAPGAYYAVYSDFRVDPSHPLPYGAGYGMNWDPLDADADGVLVSRDNCPNYPNVDQHDGDLDGMGDLCDMWSNDPFNDPDSDGIATPNDNCPFHGNLFQEDADADGYGDMCDFCQTTAEAVTRDLDHDGTGDACDTDIDGDGSLNAADLDNDNDGIPDHPAGSTGACHWPVVTNCDDNCAWVPNRRQLDDDVDGQGNECDTNDMVVQNVVVNRVPPPSVRGQWDKEQGAKTYNVYFGLPERFASGNPGYCYRPGVAVAGASLTDVPPPGKAYWYVITAVTAAGVEGKAGKRSDGTDRALPPGPCDAAAASDWDKDTVANGADNCPLDANATQADLDRDGSGDACDRFPGDPGNDALDTDGVGSNIDNCPRVANPQQQDSDGDGVGDACDDCPQAYDPMQLDSNGNGIADACDQDIDADGIVNALDADADGDGIPEQGGAGPCTGGQTVGCSDNCPITPNGGQFDRNGDGIGDACDVNDGEVQGLRFVQASGAPTRLEWVKETGATTYSVYTDLVPNVPGGMGECLAGAISLPWLDLSGNVAAGTARWYLVTGWFNGTQGSAGRTSDGVERTLPAGCP